MSALTLNSFQELLRSAAAIAWFNPCRGRWPGRDSWASIYGVAQSRTQLKRLSSRSSSKLSSRDSLLFSTDCSWCDLCQIHVCLFLRAIPFFFHPMFLTCFGLFESYCSSYWGFPGGSEGKASAWIAGDLGSIPGLGRSPGEGNGNPLQYSCRENLMDRGWWAIVYRVTKELDMI